jgi:hypothetical protein
MPVLGEGGSMLKRQLFSSKQMLIAKIEGFGTKKVKQKRLKLHRLV